MSQEMLDQLLQQADETIKENIEKIEKNQIIFDEKLKKIQQFLIENKEQIQCIGDLKNQILDMNNKLDVLLSERTLRH